MTVSSPAVVDAQGALAAYINSLTGDLVGAGNPLELGVWIGNAPRHSSRPRGAYRGAYGVLSLAGGGPNALDSLPWSLPLVSASIYGVSDLTAMTAAVAYANALLAVNDRAPARITWTPSDQVERSCLLLSVESVTGPLEVANPGAESRYLVDAIPVFQPV